MKYLRKLGLFLIVIVILHPLQPAAAQDVETCNGGYSGSHWMVLECYPGYATPHDWIKIYSREGFDSSQPWQSNLDYTNSIWIFEPASQSWASLIVDFHHTADGLVADLYDDGNRDDEVSYQLEGNEPIITENGGHWSLRVIARDGWWRHGGIVNYNLDILVDGGMQASLMEDVRLGLLEAGMIKTDGTVDFEVHVKDLNRDGKPDYEWRQNRYPLPEDPEVSGQVRTEINVNTVGDEPTFQESIFWPYLDRVAGSFMAVGLPPIRVDWRRASILDVARFVQARARPGSYSILSKVRLQEGKTTSLDFENPIAFYDLANVKDGYSDLNIHFGILPPYSFEAMRENETPLNDIEYVWDQYHTQHWDYQVGLAGRQTINEVIHFPEFSIRTVPYEKLPEWVISQTWDVATFVQVETTPYYNSEIVWGWNTMVGSDAVRREYLPGITSTPPVEDFSSSEIGLRGEYAFNYSSRPFLYFSPIDHRLHLLKAQAGTFWVDNHHKIQYQNLGGDYINQWTLLTDERPVQRLFFGSGYLIYADGSTVKLTRSSLDPSLFTTLPPSNHAEWLKLGETLLQNKPTFSPEVFKDDFKALLEQFGEADYSITGASWRDLRVIKGGFRFILTLQNGFRVIGEDLLGVSGRAAGQYAVSYDGTFHLVPFTPADIQLSFISTQPAADSPTEYMENDLQVSLRNAGQEDVQQVQVSLLMAPPGQEVVWTDAQTVTVLAGQSTAVHLLWTPSHPGEWKLWARARWVDDHSKYHTSVTAEKVVKVQAAQETSRQQELSAFGVVAPWQVLLLLAGMATVTGLTGWVLTRPPGKEVEPQAEGATKAGPQ